MKLAVIGSTNGTDLVPIVDAINSGKLLASVEAVSYKHLTLPTILLV